MHESNPPAPKWLFVTPEMADAMRSQTGNRELRNTNIMALANEMKTGAFDHRKCPDPIILDSRGKAINGNHRVHAICESGVGGWFLVAKWDTTTSSLRCDLGSSRTVADVSGADRRVAEVCRFIAGIGINGHCHGKAIRIPMVLPYVTAFGREAQRLVDFCGSTRKGTSTAIVRSAVVLRVMMAAPDRDIIHEQYRKLVLMEDGKWAAVNRLMVYLARGDSNNRTSVFVRAYLAFNSACQASDKSVVTSRIETKIVADLREFITKKAKV